MNKQPHQKKPSEWMKYAGIGTEMVLVIGLFTYLGNRLDQRQQSETPWFTILMLFVGLSVALYLVFKQLK